VYGLKSCIIQPNHSKSAKTRPFSRKRTRPQSRCQRHQTLWPTFDANYNTTGLLTDQGVTVERYAYTPYGERVILNGDQNYANTGADADGAEWTVDTNGSDFLYGGSGFQGLRWDAETGNWQQRARYTNSALGRFQQRDSKLYVDGFDLYELERSSPTLYTDPWGTETEDDKAMRRVQEAQQRWHRAGYAFAAELSWNFIYNTHAQTGVKYPDAGSAYQKYANEIGGSVEFKGAIVSAVFHFLHSKGQDGSNEWEGSVPDHTIEDLKRMNYWANLSYSSGPLFYALGDAKIGNMGFKLKICDHQVTGGGTILVNDLYNFRETGMGNWRNLYPEYAAFNHLASKMGRVAFWHTEELKVSVNFRMRSTRGINLDEAVTVSA
jgi:RHS repeat-associated protein